MAPPTPPTSPSSPTPAPDPASKAYQPAAVQPRIWKKWEDSGAFHANPANVLSGEKKPFCILIPPPNVTGALHLGHALNNTLQDILTRAHRMMGFETLWMPGTDHAGIATQAVVEKRLRKEGKLKGPLKSAFTREQFIAQVQQWKDEYEATITGQLKAMGCSCDYGRQRFTMDDICARAVREAFFRLFKDGLIYRGKRLVNWDPALQTAVADDECYEEEVDTSFWYLRYPLVRASTSPERSEGLDASSTKTPHFVRGSSDTSPVTWNELTRLGYPGADQHPGEEPAWVTVATTRPETYLGDTAVAVNPHDPRAKALRGLSAELPLVGRIIPIVEDSYVVLPEHLARNEEEKNDPKAKYATGFLKVTPAHDQNDAELGQRHNLAAINMMSPDGKVSDKHGWTDVGDAHLLVGLSMADARKKVVAEFEARGLLEATKPYRQSKTFSDRSKAVIEPYLSDQWYVRVTDDKLSGAANRALVPEQRTSRAAGLAPRGAAGAPPVGTGATPGYPGATQADAGAPSGYPGALPADAGATSGYPGAPQADAGATPAGTGAAPGYRKTTPVGAKMPLAGTGAGSASENARNCPTDSGDGSMRFYPARYAKTYEQWHDNIRDWCISRQLWWGHRIPVWHISVPTTPWDKDTDGDLSSQLVNRGLDHALLEEIPTVATQVLDRRTGKWLDRAERVALGRSNRASGEYDIYLCILDNHYKSYFEKVHLQQDPDVLDTWFSSALWPLSTMGWPEPPKDMVGLLDSFNPTTVLSTAREIITLWVSRMVMMNRYFTGAGNGHGQIPFHNVFIHAVVQDGEGRKMSKSLGNGVDPLDIIETHGADAMRFTLAQMATNTQDVRMPVKRDAKTGKNSSDKFDAGRNFCNKLWNASRFAIAILQKGGSGASPGTGATQSPGLRPSLCLTDRWLLSRLGRAIRGCEAALANYEFADYGQTLYQLLWWDFCDWYLEAIKPTVEKDAGQQVVLRTGLETILRLLHPVTPFVTEAIHEQLAAALGQPQTLLCTSAWPKAADFPIDEQAEKQFEELRDLINTIRNIRSEHQVLPKRRITLHCSDAAAKRFAAAAPGLVENLAGLEAISTTKPTAAHVAFTASGEEMHLSNLADAGVALDAGAEKDRLTKLLADLKKSEGALAGRLNNPGYAAKAPPKLVEESKAQLAKIQSEIAATEAKLKSL